MKKFLLTLFLAFSIILVPVQDNQIIFAYNYNKKTDNVLNLHASVWGSGVPSINDFVKTRQQMGLNGFGISSLIINHNSNVLLVGPTKNKVFKKTEDLTSVNKNTELLKESKLYKNYSNPFNPTIKEEFSFHLNNNFEMTIQQR